MIFATVGTQLGFDRLVMSLDEWKATHPETEVFGQIGPSTYKPRHFEYCSLLLPADYARCIRRTRLLVSHAGVGTIITGLQNNLPIVVMPRRFDKGEHRSDHQIATVRRLRRIDGVYVANSSDELAHLLDRFLEDGLAPIGFDAKVSQNTLIDGIRNWIKYA